MATRHAPHGASPAALWAAGGRGRRSTAGRPFFGAAVRPRRGQARGRARPPPAPRHPGIHHSQGLATGRRRTRRPPRGATPPRAAADRAAASRGRRPPTPSPRSSGRPTAPWTRCWPTWWAAARPLSATASRRGGRRRSRGGRGSRRARRRRHTPCRRRLSWACTRCPWDWWRARWRPPRASGRGRCSRRGSRPRPPAAAGRGGPGEAATGGVVVRGWVGKEGGGVQALGCRLFGGAMSQGPSCSPDAKNPFHRPCPPPSLFVLGPHARAALDLAARPRPPRTQKNAGQTPPPRAPRRPAGPRHLPLPRRLPPPLHPALGGIDLAVRQAGVPGGV